MNAMAASRKRKRPFGKHAWLSVLGGLLMTFGMAGMTNAYWAAGGTGSGSGPVGTLVAPTLIGTPGAGTVALSWDQVTPLGAPAVSYFVNGAHAGCPMSKTTATTATSCTDSGLIPGTYSYTVTAVWQSWTATSSSVLVTVAGLAPVNTALPVISGTATQDQVLSTTTGSWTNSPTGYGYLWQRCDSGGSNCVAILGATTSTYTLVYADAGSTMRVVVTATNPSGSTAATSAQYPASGTVTGLAPVNTALPLISGVVEEGQVLSTTNGSWTNLPTDYTYQWQRCDSAGICLNIGATASTYSVLSGDVGSTMRVVVTATNPYGSTGATSNATEVVVPAGTYKPVNELLPSISGTVAVNNTLTADPGTWKNSPTSYSPIPPYAYQWQRCNPADHNCSDISGSTLSTYFIASNPGNWTFKVVVTATNLSGSASATSLPTP